MKKLYEWQKFGDLDKLDIYEGKMGIIVGSERTGYTVFANKDKDLKIHSDGAIDYYPSHGRLDTYSAKATAVKALETVEKALSPTSDKIIEIPIERQREIGDAHTLLNARGKGGILIHNPLHPEGKWHERGHIELGHFSPRCKKRTITKEKEAIQFAIQQMKKRNTYNDNVRQRMARRLATYMDGDYEKALSLVRSQEKHSSEDLIAPKRIVKTNWQEPTSYIRKAKKAKSKGRGGYPAKIVRVR